jgi:hypothetical protein
MNKQELISQLNIAQNNFILGIAALGLLIQERNYPTLEQLVCIMTETSFFFEEVSKISNHFQNTQFPIKVAPFPLSIAAKYIREADAAQIQQIQKEFFAMLLRVFIKESFEVIKDYCKNTNQETLLKQQKWYHFSRIIRNALSHNFVIELRDSEKKLLPIVWRGRSITDVMNGQPLNTSLLSIEDALELYKEMRTFVDTLY